MNSIEEFKSNLIQHAQSIDDFEIEQKIGQGAYGQIVVVSPKICDTEEGQEEEEEEEEESNIKEKMKNRFVAKFDEKMKLEGIEKQDPQIKNEQQIYHQLWNLTSSERKKMQKAHGLNLRTEELPPFGVARMYCHGESEENHYLVIDRFGIDLQKLLDLDEYEHPKTKRHQFPCMVVLQIAIDLVHICQFLHSRGVVHRDLKPENIVLPLFFLQEDFVGSIPHRELHLSVIDFGLSNIFIEWDSSSKQIKHKPLQRTYKSIDGTTRYASLNTHYGYSASRRDDLETVGYILLYFSNGTLPWSGLYEDLKKRFLDTKELNHQWQNQVSLLKTSFSKDLGKLCHLESQRLEEIEEDTEQKMMMYKIRQITSQALQEYFSTIFQLRYYQAPPYEKLNQCFRNALEQIGKIQESHMRNGKFEDVLSKDWMFMGVDKFLEN